MFSTVRLSLYSLLTGQGNCPLEEPIIPKTPIHPTYLLIAGEETIVSHLFENGVLYAIQPGGILQVTPERRAAVETLIQLSTDPRVYDTDALAPGSPLASGSVARLLNGNDDGDGRHAPSREGLEAAAKPLTSALQASGIKIVLVPRLMAPRYVPMTDGFVAKLTESGVYYSSQCQPKNRPTYCYRLRWPSSKSIPIPHSNFQANELLQANSYLTTRHNLAQCPAE